MHKGGKVSPTRQAAPASPLEQVLANLRAQQLGAATVADLGLPEAFLKRVAGRVLQLSFQENFRIVVADAPGVTEHPVWKAEHAAAELPVVRADFKDADAPEGPIVPPESRGFLPPLIAGDAAITRQPGGDAAAATIIALRLARDGILLTAAKALASMESPLDAAAALGALSRSGFPADLLAHFAAPDLPTGTESGSTLGWIIGHVIAEPAESWPRMLSRARFQFQPTIRGFQLSPDSGQTSPAAARVQVSRPGYWIGPGDGGSLDVLRQVLEALPEITVVASIEARHVADFCAATADWPQAICNRMKVIAQDLTVSQWAQDGAKDGAVEGKPVTLLPRFASRGEELSRYVPGDTYLGAALQHAGVTVAHSPLLFQGGNLILVQEPGGRRVLLAGEAEVYRNQALGLTHEQVMSALTAEFGADRCLVLPAASIHIDYEVSCRTTDSKVVAFVLDTSAGAKLVVEAGIEVLERIGATPPAQASAVREHLRAGRLFDAAMLVWAGLMSRAVGPGRLPLHLAPEFRVGPADSGVGNLHRLMAACDLLLSSSPHAINSIPDFNTRTYLASLAKRADDRSLIKTTLRNLGWTVVPVPGIAQGDRSINSLNGLHTPDAYLMPVYGGLYSRVDEAAASAVQTALGGGVRIIPIRTGESQRRDGALRCSVALMSR